MKKEWYFESERLQYRSIQLGDTETLVSWRSRPDRIRYYCNPVPITREAHMEWFRNSYLKDPSRADFLVSDRDTAVGFVALLHMDQSAGRSEISYTIGNTDYTGRRLSMEMIRALCLFGKETFKLKVFTARIHRDNISSRKAAVSAGFSLKDSSEIFWEYRKG